MSSDIEHVKSEMKQMDQAMTENKKQQKEAASANTTNFSSERDIKELKDKSGELERKLDFLIKSGRK